MGVFWTGREGLEVVAWFSSGPHSKGLVVAGLRISQWIDFVNPLWKPENHVFGINESESHDELDFPNYHSVSGGSRERRQALRLYHAEVTQTKSGTGTGSS